MRGKYERRPVAKIIPPQQTISRKEDEMIKAQSHPQIFGDIVSLVLVEDPETGAITVQKIDFGKIHKTIDDLCRSDMHFQQAAEDYWSGLNEINSAAMAFQKVSATVTKLKLNWIQEEFLSQSYCLVQKPNSYNSVRFLTDRMAVQAASQL